MRLNHTLRTAIDLTKPKKTRKTNIIFYFIQILEFTIFAIGSILILWIYTPFDFWTKLGITLFSFVAFTDLYKNFLYVRWILITEGTK